MRLTAGLFAALCVLVLPWPSLLWAGTTLTRCVWPSLLLPLPVWLLDPIDHWVYDHWERTVPEGKLRPCPEVQGLSSVEPRDMDAPLLFRGAMRNLTQGTLNQWEAEFFARPPIGDLEVDYFTDARRINTVPDSRAKIKFIIANISKGGPEKLSTEMVFRSFPELLDQAAGDLRQLDHTFGGKGYFSRDQLGLFLTLPLFIAKGREEETPMHVPRTDFHCEPISNAVVQIQGKKTWLLALPGQSRRLRPQASPDGRAYFYSTLSPDSPLFDKVDRCYAETRPGDVLWVPAWTWHRVDYEQGVLALSVSLFHVRKWEMVANHPLYALLVIPNLIKELVGWKTQ
jgi:hypothetical protein